MTKSRKLCRDGEPCLPTTGAEALCCLVQHGEQAVPHLVERLARDFDVHVTREQLYEWSNPYRPDAHLACPMRVVIALTRIQRNPVIVEWLGHEIGYRLELLAPEGRVDAIEREYLDVAVVHGRLADGVREATADRVIDDRERAMLRATISQARRELADLEAAVEAGR